jgi:hypothetical protein
MPPEVENGQAHADASKTYISMDMVNYTCNHGYSPVEPQSITCQSDGTWSRIPTCTSTSTQSVTADASNQLTSIAAGKH